jgi:protein-tyrosine phosphatase
MNHPEEDIDDGDRLEEDRSSEVNEAFILEEDVVDSVVPDLTEEYGPLLENVRQIVKFFRSVH